LKVLPFFCPVNEDLAAGLFMAKLRESSVIENYLAFVIAFILPDFENTEVAFFGTVLVN
jgi:hypothetical protein